MGNKKLIFLSTIKMFCLSHLCAILSILLQVCNRWTDKYSKKNYKHILANITVTLNYFLIQKLTNF